MVSVYITSVSNVKYILLDSAQSFLVTSVNGLRHTLNIN